MMKYYLKTPYACDIYNIQVAPWNGSIDDSKGIIFDESQKVIFESLVREIRFCMEEFWTGHCYNGDTYYSYVTTGNSSHLRRLRLIKNKTRIKKKKDVRTCPCNYFVEESDAKELCRRLKDIFKKYGVTIE